LSKVDRAGRWDIFQVRKRSGWDRGLRLEASGRGLVGHAGAVLLHRTAAVAFTSGFTITSLEEAAIADLPEHAWTAAIEQDGSLDPVAQDAELTGLWRRNGWPEGLRYIARRVKPTEPASQGNDYGRRIEADGDVMPEKWDRLGGYSMPGAGHDGLLREGERCSQNSSSRRRPSPCPRNRRTRRPVVASVRHRSGEPEHALGLFRNHQQSIDRTLRLNVGPNGGRWIGWVSVAG